MVCSNVPVICIVTSNCFITAYEYIPDSEIGIMTGQSGSEEDLLDKVLSINIQCMYC